MSALTPCCGGNSPAWYLASGRMRSCKVPLAMKTRLSGPLFLETIAAERASTPLAAKQITSTRSLLDRAGVCATRCFRKQHRHISPVLLVFEQQDPAYVHIFE